MKIDLLNSLTDINTYTNSYKNFSVGKMPVFYNNTLSGPDILNTKISPQNQSNLNLGPSKCGAQNSTRMWIPPNSRIVNSNATGPSNRIEIISPRGYAYAGYTNTGTFSLIDNPNICVSCGCKDVGIGGCTAWEKATGGWVCKPSLNSSCQNCNDPLISNFEDIIFNCGGFINLNESVKFVNKETTLPAAFKAMFEIKEVNDMLNDFIAKVYQGYSKPQLRRIGNFEIAPDGYKMVMINLCGRATIVCVPSSAAQDISSAGDAGTCSCNPPDSNDTGKGCLYDTTGGRHCNGTCTFNCDLCTGVMSNDFFITVHKAISYSH